MSQCSRLSKTDVYEKIAEQYHYCRGYKDGSKDMKATFLVWLKLHKNEAITEKLIQKAREQL